MTEVGKILVRNNRIVGVLDGTLNRILDLALMSHNVDFRTLRVLVQDG